MLCGSVPYPARVASLISTLSVEKCSNLPLTRFEITAAPLSFIIVNQRRALLIPDTLTDIIPASNRVTLEGPFSGTFIVA